MPTTRWFICSLILTEEKPIIERPPIHIGGLSMQSESVPLSRNRLRQIDLSTTWRKVRQRDQAAWSPPLPRWAAISTIWLQRPRDSMWV